MPFRDPALRPIGVARQIDRDIHATVDVTPGRGEEPAHPTPGRAASATGRRTWNESSEDQPPIGIERRDLTEDPDRTTFLVRGDDDRGERNRHEDERHPAPGNVASPQRCLNAHVCCTMRAQRGIAIQDAQVLGNATTKSML